MSLSAFGFQTKKRTPSEVECAFSKVISSSNGKLNILGQAHFLLPINRDNPCISNGEFSCYLLKNSQQQRSLLFQPVYISSIDTPTASCGLYEVINFYLMNLKSLKCEQILIPIPEVAKSRFSNQDSNHFILLVIQLDVDGEPICSITYDSNTSTNPRLNREKDIQHILANILGLKEHQGRKYLNLQQMIDNTSCPYFVLLFIKTLSISPREALFDEDSVVTGFFYKACQFLGFISSDIAFEETIKEDFAKMFPESDIKDPPYFDRSNGVFRSELFNHSESNLRSREFDVVKYSFCEILEEKSFSKIAGNLRFVHTVRESISACEKDLVQEENTAIVYSFLLICQTTEPSSSSKESSFREREKHYPKSLSHSSVN